MARIRSIKPEFWDSPGTAKASLRARLLYIAMWNWADDWGIGDANPKRLLGFAFPSDESSEVEPRNFRHLAVEVAECFDVIWYQADGRDYYAIPSWETHQRTEKRAQRRNITPDQRKCLLYAAVSENPSLDLGSSVEGTGEQGKGEEGTGERGKVPAIAVTTPGSELAIADRPDVDRLCALLADHIESNGGKRPSIGKGWRDAARLMLDRDGRTEEQITKAINWCQRDEFWRGVVLSMPKLREKYDTLRLQAQRKTTKTTNGDIDWDAAFERAKAKDARNQEIA